MNTSLRRWLDYAILTVAFFLIVHNLDAPRFLSDNSYYELYASNAGTGSTSKQLGVIILFLYGFLACVSTRKMIFSLDSFLVKLATAFLFLITVSISWSVAPSASFARWFGFIAYTLAAIGMFKRLSPANVIRWYVLAHSLYLLIGLVNEIVLGTFTPFRGDYRFSGISDPNSTGIDAAMLVFSSVAMLQIKPGSWRYRASLIMAIAFLLLTKSRTALLSVTFTLVIFHTLVSLRNARIFICTIAIFVACPLILDSMGLLDLQSYLSMGRHNSYDSTMTGRVPLWTELYEVNILTHPFLGYGYGGFWTPERSQAISSDQGWTISAAHSIYIDATLALGFIGLLLYVALLLNLMTRSILAARRGRKEAFFFACLVLAALFDGMSDSGPWYISSIYLFGCIQSFVAVSSIEFKSAITTLSRLDIATARP